MVKSGVFNNVKLQAIGVPKRGEGKYRATKSSALA